MRRLGLVLNLGLLLVAGVAEGQLARRDGAAEVAPTATRRMRIILKDGGYQICTSYRVVGDRVRYVSAERGGETEEIPLRLVDLPATERWTREHAEGGGKQGPVLDPELAKEEADRAALSPEVAKNLRLVPEENVLAFDTFRGVPELVPLAQTDGQLERPVGHAILKGVVNPMSAAHQVVVLKGEKAAVQVHVERPEFYLRLDDTQVSGGGALTVDTHGASSSAKNRAAGEPNEYVIVRTDVRQDARVVESFHIAGQREENVTETDETVLPGGHWLKVVPRAGLLFGEYALVEVLGAREINLGVWDFGVHPTAPENRDAVVPEEPRKGGLERRPQ